MPYGLSAPFVSNVATLQGVSVCRTEIGTVVPGYSGGGLFTCSGGTPARAGLMRGYRKLMNLFRVKENYLAIADEESF